MNNKTFLDTLLIETGDKGTNVSHLPPLNESLLPELPLFDEEERLIVLHRDAHFGGNFSLMYEYYLDEGKGAVLDVSTQRIESLAHLEEKLQQNIASILLNDNDIQTIAFSRKLYEQLKNIYSGKKESDPLRAIADLILSENDPYEDAQTIKRYGKAVIPLLIQLVKTDVFYEDTSPGYGQAPIAAVIALGELKAAEAIPSLFALVGSDNFELESAAIEALRKIGSPAKNLCVQIFTSRPITTDNERAALVLLAFSDDTEVTQLFSNALDDHEVQKRPLLFQYLTGNK